MGSHRAPGRPVTPRGPLDPEGSKFLKGLYATLIFLAFVVTVIMVTAIFVPPIK